MTSTMCPVCHKMCNGKLALKVHIKANHPKEWKKWKGSGL